MKLVLPENRKMMKTAAVLMGQEGRFLEKQYNLVGRKMLKDVDR
jgi:hypothetical protein